jgi:serine/threonine protein kinase
VYSCSGRCPSGRYSEKVGLVSSDECTKCPIDTYSEQTGASTDTCKTCPDGYNGNAAVGATQCELIPVVVQMSPVDWIVVTCGAVVLLAGGFVFYRYRMRQRDVDSETQMTQMNQTLLQADAQLQRAINPLEQSQYSIPSHDLQLGERIGAGGNGWIYKATMGANTIVAAKEIMSTTIDPEDLLEFEHEAKMLTQLNHPQVLRVFGFCIKRAEENIDDQERRYIVTEFAPNGSLEQVIVKAAKIAPLLASESKSNGRIKMPFTKLQALEWAVQIASGTAFLHRKGYVHRDMKPQNVLLNKSNDALVADLGTVRRPPSGLYPNDQVEPSTITTTEKRNNIESYCDVVDQEKGNAITCTMHTVRGMTSMKGTPMYMAPEQFEEPNYSYPVDVWAYGLTLVRLFTLKWPYPLETGLRDLVMGVARGALRPEEVELDQVPDEEVLHVIKACLAIEASKRPTMREVERRLTEVLKRLMKEEEVRLKSERDKERRRIMDIKKHRRIKRREERERKSGGENR